MTQRKTKLQKDPVVVVDERGLKLPPNRISGGFSASGPFAAAQGLSIIPKGSLVYEGPMYKHSGTLKGLTKRVFRLYSDGWVASIRRNRRPYLLFNIQNSVVTASTRDPRRFEVDSGEGVLHMKVPRAGDREVWLRALSSVQIVLQTAPKDALAAAADHLSVVESKLDVLVRGRGAMDAMIAEISAPCDAAPPSPQLLCEVASHLDIQSQACQHVVESLSKVYELLRGLSEATCGVPYGVQGAAAADRRPPETLVEVPPLGDGDDEAYFDAMPLMEESLTSSTDGGGGDALVSTSESCVAQRPSEAEPASPHYPDREVMIQIARGRVSALLAMGSSMSTGLGAGAAPSAASILALVPPLHVRRTELPADAAGSSATKTLVKILRQSIGRDLSRVAIPIGFCEPLSMLQRLCEDFEYADLLNQAAEEPDSMRRLVLVSAFAASGYASTADRIRKPLNPVLGETYEYICPNLGFAYLAEQVSHHPPVSAGIAESPKWAVQHCTSVRNKFWGKSIEVFPLGGVTCQIRRYGDTYTWNRVVTCINNVIVGTKWIDNYGELTVTNQATGETCLLDFKRTRWFDNAAAARQVRGAALDSSGAVQYAIRGSWSEKLESTRVGADGKEVGEPTTIWTAAPRPAKSTQQYNFGALSMELNNLPDWLAAGLPRTDSRWRGDQRLMENGRVDEATAEKERLEAKQRRRKEEHVGQSPRWFSQQTENNWVYSGAYWQIRTGHGAWPEDLLDLFAHDS